ncbi:MAG: ABC transporter ATP-binding protein [Lachnospiraceae bacterium]|nr:ABC transporter ATP-binding protein [Lachnospiraceae bacterium]
MGKSTRAGLAGTDMNTAFEVRNLYAFYGKKRPKDSENMVLRDVNLVIPSGSALGIIGPNGAGKSTLLRTLAGIIPSEGEIYLFGEPLAEKKRREIACCCALMSQFFPVGFAYSVRKTVEMARYARGQRGMRDRIVVQRSLEEAGLQELADRPITELSGGQLQRVFFARALAQETPILLLDEPASSLDLQYQAELAELLIRWKKRQTTLPDGRTVPNTLISVCHDLSLALDLSDDLVLLKDGRVLAAGPGDQVLSRSLLQSVYGMDVPAYMLRREDFWKTLIARET